MYKTITEATEKEIKSTLLDIKLLENGYKRLWLTINESWGDWLQVTYNKKNHLWETAKGEIVKTEDIIKQFEGLNVGFEIEWGY